VPEQATNPVEPRGIKAIFQFLSTFAWKEFISGAVSSIANEQKGSPVARILWFTVCFYKEHFSRPYSVCIYKPSCSAYILEAVQRHGVIKGGTMAMQRLLRCRPPYRGGYDPVPRV